MKHVLKLNWQEIHYSNLISDKVKWFKLRELHQTLQKYISDIFLMFIDELM